MDITQELRKAEAESSDLTLRLSGKVIGLHGRGSTRTQTLESTLQSHEETEERSSEEKEETRASSRQIKRQTIEKVFTFARNERGEAVAPLGGRNGYLMGALKEAMKMDPTPKKGDLLYGFKGAFSSIVFIEPLEISLDGKLNDPKAPKGYLIQGRRGVSFPEFYDYILEAPFELTLRAEKDISKELVIRLLARVQRLGIGPKRRGRIVIEKLEEISY